MLGVHWNTPRWTCFYQQNQVIHAGHSVCQLVPSKPLTMPAESFLWLPYLKVPLCLTLRSVLSDQLSLLMRLQTNWTTSWSNQVILHWCNMNYHLLLHSLMSAPHLQLLAHLCQHLGLQHSCWKPPLSNLLCRSARDLVVNTHRISCPFCIMFRLRSCIAACLYVFPFGICFLIKHYWLLLFPDSILITSLQMIMPSTSSRRKWLYSWAHLNCVGMTFPQCLLMMGLWFIWLVSLICHPLSLYSQFDNLH